MRIKVFIAFLLLGAAIVGAAFFAEIIGLDNDPGWGKGRVAIFVIGVLVIVWGILYFLYADKILSALRPVRSHLKGSFTQLQASTKRYWYTLPVVVFVLLIYVWFASAGSWTSWNSATRYYADLADAFEQGQLHLTTRPNSQLLSLSNPYDPAQRKGIPFPIDYTLYNSKFYLYWGPVPALILVLLDPFLFGKVGDLMLAFSFTSGIFVLHYLFLLTIWDRFFQSLPRWILLLSILVAGLSGPWAYMLVNEPNGRIYEAAISGAQFFLLGGLFVIAWALNQADLSYSSLALAGLLWGLAMGTRLTIAVPVGIVCLMLVYHLGKSNRSSFLSFGRKVLALGLPLGFCVLSIGWYNWARFGSVTDTGFGYSLAHQDMLKYRDELFSPIYMLQNAYNYLLKAPASTTNFPFMLAVRGNKNIVPFLYSLPEVYRSQPITGLLYIAPFTAFALTPVFLRRRSQQHATAERNRSLALNPILGLLWGSFFSAFGFLLVFFWSAPRYIADFLPPLMMAGIFGFCYGYQMLSQKPVSQKVYSVVGIILGVTGIAISLLIALSANQYSSIGFQAFT